MRFLLPMSIVSLIALAHPFKADAQDSDEILRSAYCYGAYSGMEIVMNQMPPTSASPPSYKEMWQQSLAELDHDKKEFLDYIIAKAALGSMGTTLAMKQGETDEDLTGTPLDPAERTAINNKMKGCQAVLGQLPL